MVARDAAVASREHQAHPSSTGPSLSGLNARHVGRGYRADRTTCAAPCKIPNRRARRNIGCLRRRNRYTDITARAEYAVTGIWPVPGSISLRCESASPPTSSTPGGDNADLIIFRSSRSSCFGTPRTTTPQWTSPGPDTTASLRSSAPHRRAARLKAHASNSARPLRWCNADHQDSSASSSVDLSCRESGRAWRHRRFGLRCSVPAILDLLVSAV